MAPKRGYDEFMQSMKSLLETGKHSDFKIVCGEETWHVHKAIVCSQSKVFDAATRFGGTETTEDVLNLPSDDPEDVGCMVQFMYEMDYQLPSDGVPGPWWIKGGGATNMIFSKAGVRRNWDLYSWTSSSKNMASLTEKHPRLKDKSTFKVIILGSNKDDEAVLESMIELFKQRKNENSSDNLPPANYRDAIIHAHVYAMGDKYDLGGLKKMAASKFEESLKSMFSGNGFFAAVTVAFTTTPDSDITLREIVAKHIYEEKKAYGLYDKLDESMRTTPGLAYHVWKYEWSVTATK